MTVTNVSSSNELQGVHKVKKAAVDPAAFAQLFASFSTNTSTAGTTTDTSTMPDKDSLMGLPPMMGGMKPPPPPKEFLDKLVAEAVEKGVITQDQADEILASLESDDKTASKTAIAELITKLLAELQALDEDDTNTVAATTSVDTTIDGTVSVDEEADTTVTAA